MKLNENKNTVPYTDVSFTCHLEIIENSLKDHFFFLTEEVEIEGKWKVLIMALVKSTRILGHLFASEGHWQAEKNVYFKRLLFNPYYPFVNTRYLKETISEQ